MHPRAPKTAPEGPKTAPQASKMAEEATKTAPRAGPDGGHGRTFRVPGPKRRPGRSRWPPSAPQEPLRGPQKAPPEASKLLPIGSLQKDPKKYP
eukprot:2821821-Pyramimonas_sp.AAC.1